jgi:D-glycero-D-manno-heptose 1,7-bisphosphate phosphatase
MLKPAAFLDRDGVLNRSFVREGKPYAPRSLPEFEILPGVLEALQRLKQAGFVLVVVTNQPDVGNGLVDRQVVEAMNEQLRQTLPVDEIIVCYHSQTAGCLCRKPKPGMLLQASETMMIDLEQSVMIGDRAGDVAAGKAAGCKTVFIDCGYGEAKPSEMDWVAGSLAEAVDQLLGVGS